MFGSEELNKIVLIITIVFTILGLSGKCGYHAPPEYKRIFELPTASQQREEFKKLPLDKQVDMFRYAMYREPPATGYIDLLASNGDKVIPHLLHRLKEERSDYAKTTLIQVFQSMHKNYYSLRDEEEVIETLKTVCAGIGDREYKKESENYIKTIVDQPGFNNK